MNRFTFAVVESMCVVVGGLSGLVLFPMAMKAADSQQARRH